MLLLLRTAGAVRKLFQYFILTLAFRKKMDLTFLKNVLKLFYQSLPFSFQTMTHKLGVLNKTLYYLYPCNL